MPLRAVRAAALAAVLLGQLILCVASMRNDSATDDEPAHVATGVMETRFGRMGLLESEPPLLHAIVGAVLLTQHVNLPSVWFTERNPWRLGRLLIYRAHNDADALLFAARLPTVFLYLLLTVVIYAWCRTLTGSFAASFTAAALVAFCPNLIAHGRLATADVGAALAMVAATFAFLRWLDEERFSRAIVAGLLLAFALLVKVSALILLPWILVLLYVRAISRPVQRSSVAQAVSLFAVAAVSIEVFFLAETRSLTLAGPFREYLRIVSLINRYYASGHNHPQFFFGRFSYHGWWYYYPAAFLLKTTIPALLLIALSVGLVGWRFRLRGHHAIGLTAFVILFVAATLHSDVDVGIRLMLPIVPFLYLGAGLCVARAATIYGARRVYAVVAALLAWHAGEAIATYPNYIGYFNEFIGSEASADRYLVDSNLDWGQDLKRLAEWSAAHRVDRLRLDYFGGSDPEYYLGPRFIDWPAPRPQPLPSGYFAVSRHFYRLSFFYRDYGMDYDRYLAGARQVETINGSINVYYKP